MAPHFFHIILSPKPRLRIAKKFVRIHGANLPSLVSLEVPTGTVWEVELTRTNDEVWLDKGFQEFKEHCSIGDGYLLVFRYDGDSRFHVLVFDKSTTEVEYPYAVPKQECEENMPDDSSPLSEDRQVHSMGFVSCKGKYANPRDKEVPMKVSADHLKRGHAKRQKVGDDVSRKSSDRKRDTKTKKVSVNKGRKSARFKDSVSEAKKASMVKFALPDHQSKSIRDKRLKLKIEKPYAKTECNASTRRVRQIPVRGRKARERSIAYQRAKALDWKNPFFISLMHPTNVEDSCVMKIHKRFVKEHITSQKSCNLVLRFPDGKAWTVTLRIHSEAKFGWREVVQHNDLKVGDVCVFERENGSQDPLFKVIIFRKTEDAEGSSHRNLNRDKEDPANILDDYSSRRKKKRKGEDVADGASIEILECLPKSKTASEKPKILSNALKAEIFHSTDKKATGVSNASSNHPPNSLLRKTVKPERTEADVALTHFDQKIRISGSKRTVTKKGKEDFMSFQRAKAFKPNSPHFFVSFMQPSYVTCKVFLDFRKDFARKYLANTKYCNVVLIANGKTWKVKCCIGDPNARLHWKTFVEENHLLVGDSCVFELKNDTKRTFAVHIFRELEEDAERHGSQ